MRALCDWTRRAALGGLLAGLGLAAVAGSAAAQTPPPADTANAALGYLRFVNATGRQAPLKVKLDGVDINPQGYSSGHATGAVGFPPKTAQVELEHATLGSYRTAVTLKAGEVTTVVALPQAAEKDPKKPEAEPKVELAALVHTAPTRGQGGGSRLTVVQATPAETLTFLVDGKPLVCEKLKPVLAEGTMTDFVTLQLGETKLATLNFTDPGDRVIVFFTDEGGTVKHTSFNNTVE